MGYELTSLSPGDGKTFPKPGDKVHVHYVGTLTSDGSKFDSSYDRGKVFVTAIGIGKVIKAWDEAVLKMSVGEKALLKTSPDYAYGSRGFPPYVPPNADLTFEIVLVAIG